MERFDLLRRLSRRARSLAGLAGFALVLLMAATASATDFRDILPTYDGYDFNHDGVDEIENLEPMFDDDLAAPTPSNAELVVVLVEERLLDHVPGSTYSPSSLISRLDRFRTDLRVQGYTPKVLVAQVYAGHESDPHYHQDGRTVLAMRELLRTTADSYPKLAGAILIGDLPEAMVVRSFLWRKSDDRVTVWPQVVARRTDLVLGDLDGNWESIYHEGPAPVGAFNAVDLTAAPGNPDDWPCNGCSVESGDFVAWQETFEDFFYVADAGYGLRIGAGSPPPVTIDMIDVERGPELGPGDHTANPIAQPDILVSRINARHVAIAPDPEWRDSDGKGMLDAFGRPQVVRASSPLSWWHDPALERRLLVEYLDRNHYYRAGNGNRSLRTSAIAYPEEDFSASSLSTYLQKAATGSFLSPLKVEDGSVLDFVDFLKQPATLKGIHAHADRMITQFGDDYDDAMLEQAIGPYIWNWELQGQYWVPTLGDYGKDVGDELFYTLWRNNKLSSTGGVFYAHLGCDVNSPNEAETRPYSEPAYGRFQNAESHLFFANGVAVVARSKDFNDKPEGFTEALDDSLDTPYGAGWSRQFEEAAADSSLSDVQRKRSYNWGLLGDWTLALKPPKSETFAVFFDGYSYTSTDAKLGLGTYEKADFPLLPANVDSIAIPAQREVRVLNSANGVGRYITLREDVPDLGRFGYDNWMNSAQVRNRTSETATLYSEAGYWGSSATLPPGHYTFTQLRDAFGIDPKSVSSMVLSNVEVFLYDRQTWWNNWRAFGSSVFNLSSYGWNDRMESIVVVPKGRYGTVYQHGNWSGQHAALEPGRYDKADLQGMGLPANLEISSVSMGSQIRMKLYRQQGFGGTPLVLDAQSVGNLADLGWNDVVQSIIVELR